MIPALIVGMLALIGMIFVVSAIGRRPQSFVETNETSDAEGKKRAALTGILDLEEERDSGKLSPEEFESLRLRYERDAIGALREADATSEPTDIESRLEDEIARARSQLRCNTCGAPRASETARCPSCGSPY